MLIKQLTDLVGLPSREDEVRDFIKAEIKDHVDELRVDRLGNLIAVKNKDAKEGRHIGLSAHMDEVGMMVRGFNKDGTIRFASLGIDPRVLVSKTVKVGKDKLNGVIGSKPIHLQKPDERTVNLDLEKLYIDIGTDTDEETKKLVQIGDVVSFDSEWTEFGNHKVKAKALDDRVGCAAIIEILKSDTPYKITAAFCVQEEVGCRGSAAASKSIFADLIVNLEGTVCADTEGIDEHMTVTIQGEGPALSLKDAGSIFLRKYIDMMVSVAGKHGIPHQFRRTTAGGTDSANYHIAHGGTPVINMAVPCRYIHSAVSVMDMRDFDNLKLLLKAFVEDYNKGVI